MTRGTMRCCSREPWRIIAARINAATLIAVILLGCAPPLTDGHGVQDHPYVTNHGHEQNHISRPADKEPKGRDGILKWDKQSNYTFALLQPSGYEHHGSQLMIHHEPEDPSRWRLLCALFSGVEGIPPVSIMVHHLDRNATSWSAPEVAISKDDRSLQNPAWLWDPRNGTILLMHSSQKGKFQGRAFTEVIASEDGGKTWSEPQILFPEKGTYLRNQPLLSYNGTEWLLPLYHTPHGFHNKPSQFSELRRSSDFGATWSNGTMMAPKGMALVQPTVVRVLEEQTLEPSARLVAFFRSRHHDNVFRAESGDDGRSWTIPRPTILPNNNKAVQALTLQSGAVAIVFNNNRGEWKCDRNGVCPDGKMHPMSVALSLDEGHTWPYVRDLQSEFDGTLDFTYPSIVQTPDGSIHITYSWSSLRRRTAIRYVRITEQWIKEPYAWGFTRGVYQPHQSHAIKGTVPLR